MTPTRQETAPEALEQIAGTLLEIPLQEIDQADTRYQLRVAWTHGDILRELESGSQKDPVRLLGPKPYRIIDGFRRSAALLKLGRSTVIAIVYEGLTDDQCLGMAFALNAARRNLSAIDKANAMRLAENRGLSRMQIGISFNLSEPQVCRYLQVSKLPHAIKATIDDRVVTMAHALVLNEFEVGNVDEVAQEIHTHRYSVQQLRRVLGDKLGKKRIGRPLCFMRREGKLLTFNRLRISLDAPRAERERLLAQLHEATALVGQGLEGESLGTGPRQVANRRTPHLGKGAKEQRSGT